MILFESMSDRLNRKSNSKKLRTLDEILAPIRKEVAEKGITEKEIDSLINQARRDYYREKRGNENAN